MRTYFSSTQARKIINIYGFAIFPVHGITPEGECTCGNPSCNNKGKHPATKNGLKDATKDIEQLKTLWAGRQYLNYGIATGEASGCFVIDVDSEQSFIKLKEYCDLPETLTVKTHKGYHLFFKHPQEPVITKTNILDKIDVRGDGGYVVGAYSNHASGHVYAFHNELEDIAGAPQEILDLVVKSRIKDKPIDTQPVTPLNISSNNGRAGIVYKNEGWSIEQIKEHLDHISPDCSYDDWLMVGMGLNQEGAPFHIWDEWSSRGTKYVRGECAKKWSSFSGSGVSYGSVVHMAKQNGWKPSQKSIDITNNAISNNYTNSEIIETSNSTIDISNAQTGEISTLKRLPLVFASDINPNVEATDFIEDLLREEEFSVIYGESNCGKTFFMLDLAMHVATGMKWRDKQVDGGGVIYAALEGGAGTRNRIYAFKDHYQIKNDIPMAVIPSSINFLDTDNDIQSLLYAIREAQARIGDVKLIVIDTLARAISGGDENSSMDMGKLVINADLIRSITGAHIAFVHHSGKDAVKGARGHSSLRAAVDTEIEISRDSDDSPIKIKVSKQREMEIISEMFFNLKSVELGVNGRGKVVTSCVVMPIDQTPVISKNVSLTASEQFLFDCLTNCLIDKGYEKMPLKDSSAVKVVTYEDVYDYMLDAGFKEIDISKTDNIQAKIKEITHSARMGLKKKSKINFTKRYIWIV